MKPASVSLHAQADTKNPPQVAKEAQTLKLKGDLVQEVEQNVPSGSRAIVLLQHNTNEGSGSKNEEQMRGSTIPPSEHTDKVNTPAELTVPQVRKEHLLTVVPASDPSKSKIPKYQLDDIKPFLETDKEQLSDLKEYLGTGNDQQVQVKQSLDRVKDKTDDVCRPLGTSKDQAGDGNRSSEIPEELADNTKRSLVADIEQPGAHLLDLKAKDPPGKANTHLGTAEDPTDYVKRATREPLENTNRSLGTVKEELKEIKTSLGDAKKQPDEAHVSSEIVKDQPDDAKRAAKEQVDNAQRPLGAVIEQPDDISGTIGTAEEQLAEVTGFMALSKEQPDDVTRALETGKEEPDDTSRTLTAKEQSDDVRVGSLKNMSPESLVVPQPVPSPQHETSPDTLTKATALSEEHFLLKKIRQMAEDTDASSPSLPVPLPRPRRRLVPCESDFDLPPSPPLQHRVRATSPDRSARPVTEVSPTSALRTAVTSEEPTVDDAKFHDDGTQMSKSQNHVDLVLADEKKETSISKTNTETLEKGNVPTDRVSTEDELNGAQTETLKPSPVPDDL